MLRRRKDPLAVQAVSQLQTLGSICKDLFSGSKSILLFRAWFRSTDLWVMGPARFHCATLLDEEGVTLFIRLYDGIKYRNLFFMGV
ncbi:hypothetical protein QTP88_012427 [Uroleucon formosanum]